MDNYRKVLPFISNTQFQEQPQPNKAFSFGGGSVGSGAPQQPDNYTDENNPNDFDDEYKKEFLRNQMKSIREKLSVLGFPQIGDLFSNSNAEVEATIKALFSIIQQRSQDIQFRSTIHDKIQKLESEKNVLTSNIERLSSQKKTLENDNSNLSAKLKSTEKANKEQMQKKIEIYFVIRNKLVTEKDEIYKQFLKIQNMKAQFEHEIKHKDLQIQKFQEHVKKMSGLKASTFKNAFEVTQVIEQNGPSLFSANGEYEFSQLVMKKWEDNLEKLRKENTELKENLIRIHQALGEILQVRKDVSMKRKKIDYGDEYQAPQELEKPEEYMLQYKTELYKAPYEQTGKEAIQMLQENLGRFKELMKKFDQEYEFQSEDLENGDPTEIGKIRACKNLSELFSKILQFLYRFQKTIIIFLKLRIK